MPTERRPNLFIVGAQKSATSALAGWLSRHPEVFISNPKEPGFLAFGERGYCFPDGYGRPGPPQAYVPTTERDYLALFAAAQARHRVIGEASTWYLPEPGVAERISSFSPGAKIVISLRDPAERAYSAWCHVRARQQEPCASFAEALDNDSGRTDIEHTLRYHRMGLYSDDVAHYLEVFGKERVLLLFYQDISLDPRAQWRRLCDFLDIDAAHEPNFDNRYNASGQPRSPLLHRIIKSQRVRTLASRLLPHDVSIRIKNRIEAVNLEEFPPLDAECRARLVAYYRADISKLEQIAGRDLGAWLS